MIWLIRSDLHQDRSPNQARALSSFAPFKTWRTLAPLRHTSHCPLGMVSYKMSYKINIKVSDFEEGNIVINHKKIIWGKEWNLWTKRKIPRLSSLSTSEKGGNLAGQKLAQKRVATSTILRARQPWPVICSILSDTLPSPKYLHPSQPLLHFVLHLLLDFEHFLEINSQWLLIMLKNQSYQLLYTSTYLLPIWF